MELTPSLRRIILIGLFLGLSMAYSTLSILRHQRLNSTAYDLGMMDQTVWNTSQGRLGQLSIEVYNYFGDHMSLPLAFLAPLYWVYPHVNSLFIVQSLLLALGIFPICWIAERKLTHPWAGISFACLYAFYPAIGFISRWDFHSDAFVIPFFLLAFYYLDTEQLAKTSLFLFLALVCKEQIGFIVFMFGLYIAAFRRKYKFGLSWAAIGLIWSALALFVVIPYLRQPADILGPYTGSAPKLGRYSWLGSTPKEIILNVLLHPFEVIWSKMGYTKAYFALMKYLPLGFLHLLAPEIFFIALPDMIFNYMSYPGTSQSTIYFHYFASIIPFAFIAAIYGLARLSRIYLRIIPASLVIMPVLALTTFAIENPFIKPVGDPFWPILALEEHPEAPFFHQAASMVPLQASILTTMAYTPQFTHRREVRVFELYRGPVTQEYILLNLPDYRWWLRSKDGARKLTLKLVSLPNYGILYYQYPIILLKRDYQGMDKAPVFEQLLVERSQP